MPQLDLLTFFTQFFWAILCLFVFYFFVSKLILPELTRVLKYRSKASLLLGSEGKTDTVSLRESEESSSNLSHLSGKSGSSILYQYAISSSARVLTEARQKRDTFLSGITSEKSTRPASTLTQSSQVNALQDKASKEDSGQNGKSSSNPENLKGSSKSKGSKNLKNAKSSKSGLKGATSRDSDVV